MVASGLVNDVVYGQLAMRKTKTVLLGQVLFLAVALIIPMVFHARGVGFPAILAVQPMHWMILFAALAYGPLSGALMGMAVPVSSFLLTGMPLPAMLPLMLPELAVYGLVAGLLKGKITAFGSVAVALVAGRVVFLVLAAVLGRMMIMGNEVSAFEFVRATWAPGIPAMILQITLLPVLAGLYVNWAKD